MLVLVSMCFSCPRHRSLFDGMLKCSCKSQAWNTKGVEGVHRFLARAYRLVVGDLSDEEPSKDQLRLLHSTIKKVRAMPRASAPCFTRLCSPP